MKTTRLLAGLIMCALTSAGAQGVDSTRTASDPVIQDNSFLVEEAYNHGDGVVPQYSSITNEAGNHHFHFRR